MEGECKLCKRRKRLASCPILDEKEGGEKNEI